MKPLNLLLIMVFLTTPLFAQSYNPRFYTPQKLAQRGFNMQTPKQERIWIGTGEARANYIEGGYPLDHDFSGISWEYHEQLYHGSEGKGGWATNWALLDTRFEIDEFDDLGHRHDLKAHLLSGLWGFGLSRQLKANNDFLVMFGANLFLGIGLLQFEKKLILVSGQSHEFGQKYGFDVVTGWDGYVLSEFYESWFFGWKRSFYRNKMTVDYSEEKPAFLTHIESTLFFLGKRFGAVSCRPTLYVQCD